MAIPTARLVQDQNLGASVGGKTNVSNALKKGGPAGRRALNDISNSGKPSAHQASKKQNLSNVVSIVKDVGAAKTPFSVGGKLNLAKGAAPEKGKVSSRKALTDLTNTTDKSCNQPAAKRNPGKKLLSPLKEGFVDTSWKQEGFLHKHEECVKARRSAMDKASLLNLLGLDNESPLAVTRPPSSKPSDGSPVKPWIWEEMSTDFEVEREDFPGCTSPACSSPSPPMSPFQSWNEEPNFALR